MMLQEFLQRLMSGSAPVPPMPNRLGLAPDMLEGPGAAGPGMLAYHNALSGMSAPQPPPQAAQPFALDAQGFPPAPEPYAPPQAMQQPQMQPQQPAQMQQLLSRSGVSDAPQGASGGGIGGFLGNLFNPGGAQRAQQVNQTVNWLQGEGFDQGTATALAQNPPLLQEYLKTRMGSLDPKNALELQKMRLEIGNLANPRMTPGEEARIGLDREKFGFADEISAGLGAATGVGGQAGDYDANLAAQRQRDSEGGWERFGGQMAGAVALPIRAAASIPGAIGQGIGLGGAYGYGSGEGAVSNRIQNAGINAAVGGTIGGAARSGLNALQNRAAARSIPTNEALRATSQAGYRMADEAGVVVRPEGMQRLATSVVEDLSDFGYHPSLQPRVGVILKEMERLANRESSYKQIETLRKITGQVANSTDPAEKAIATRILNRIDDYMGNLPADDVIAGNAAQASAGIRQGRDNWARMRRSEMVDTARIKAERRANSSGTGGNVDNAIRQNVRSILDNPRRSRGMTAAEKELAEKVVQGTPTQNALRAVGRLSPTTGGLTAAMNVGATAFNPLMAIPGAVGFAAKQVADGLTTRNANLLSQVIRSGGQQAKDLAALARGGELAIPQVQRIETFAQRLGVSPSQLAAAVREKMAEMSQ